MDKKFMENALNLSLLAGRAVKTNPLVGAVIVKDGRIIGEGYHKEFGGAHAEEQAILSAKENIEGASIYVTLEPCSHFGKRPPCANLLIEKKIKRVIVACLDPNPKVAGRGVKLLQEAGIQVDIGVMEKECKKVNEAFFYHIQHKKPFVVMKTAMTLDGKIASRTGSSKWVSSEESRKKVHELRAKLDGIMVGINTVLKDDPSLNVRGVEGEDPIRIIVDSKLRISLDAKVLNLESKSKTIIATTKLCDMAKMKELQALPMVEVMIVKDKDGRVDLTNLMEELYRIQIGSILLEGGGTLNFQMLKDGLVAKLISFIAPKIIGGKEAKTPVEGQGIDLMDHAINIENLEVRQVGKDIMLEGYICSQE